MANGVLFSRLVTRGESSALGRTGAAQERLRLFCHHYDIGICKRRLRPMVCSHRCLAHAKKNLSTTLRSASGAPPRPFHTTLLRRWGTRAHLCACSLAGQAPLRLLPTLGVRAWSFIRRLDGRCWRWEPSSAHASIGARLLLPDCRCGPGHCRSAPPMLRILRW